MTNDGIGNYTFMTIVVGRYEGLFTRRSQVIFLEGEARVKYDF